MPPNAAPDAAPVPPAPKRWPGEWTKGRLGMWIFLSTEVMLFAGCIAAVMVLRISALQSGWPSAASMHSKIAIGLINTVVLTASAFAAVGAWKFARAGKSRRAKGFLLATIVLGSIFLATKAYEFRIKFRAGLLGLSSEGQIHESANRLYISAVHQRLAEHISELERRRDAGPLDEAAREQLDWAWRLRTGMTETVARRVGQSPDTDFNQNQMEILAHQVFPRTDLVGNTEEAVRFEKRELRTRREELLGHQKRAAARLTLVENQIREIETLAGQPDSVRAVSPANALLPPDQPADAWLATKREQLNEIKALQISHGRELEQVEDRIQVLEVPGAADGGRGLNYLLPFRLPVVVPNGRAWISAWLLLSGMHALHLVAGLVAFLCFVPLPLDARTIPAFSLVVLYWQFVDVVWFLIFGLLYF